MVARTGVPLSLSLAQSHRQPEAWRDLLARIEAAAAEGLPIRAQVAPRPVGRAGRAAVARTTPSLGFPAFGEIAGRPVAEQARALQRPGVPGPPAGRAAGDDETTTPGAAGGGGSSTTARLFPLGDVPDYEPAPETSVEAMAAARGVDPAALTLDLLAENDGRAFLYAPFSNYADGNLDACGEMLAPPRHPLRAGRRRRARGPHLRCQLPDLVPLALGP